jgi:AcrR family transcriptional regulator
MFETTVPSPPVPDSTRDRLLEAAGEIFAERGFREATIRDICGRAGANIAAINYHFGGKERLYSEVLRFVDNVATARNPYMAPEAGSLEVEDRLERFVLQFVKRVLDTGRPSWHERLMAREMVEPTFALDELIDRNIKPRAMALQGIVRDFLGPGATDRQVQRAAASVVGQCLFYWHCRPMIGRLMPQIGFDAQNVESIAAHIAGFSLGGLRAMRDEIAGPGGRP